MSSKQQLLSPDPPLRVACVGGGQLGRMMALEAPRLGIAMTFLDPGGIQCPCAQIVPHDRIVKGGLKDADQLRAIAQNCDVLTVEIEHVGVEILQELETSGVNVQPSARVLTIIRDKYLQKQHFASHGVPLPPFQVTSSVQEIQQAATTLGLPLMLKTRKGGYDGRGNAVLESNTEQAIQEAIQKLMPTSDQQQPQPQENLDIYAEGWIDYQCEVAVMVVRSSNGQDTVSYPAVNAIQQDSICRLVLVPVRNVSMDVRQECERVAKQAIDSLGQGASGMFGVELFVTQQGQVLLNEIAPRPHNTGHYTQDACAISQFENHLRGICGMPLGTTKLITEAAAMVNVLGAKSGTMADTLKSSNRAMSLPGAVVHWYGKAGCRAGRKMGHINVVGDSQEQVDAVLEELLALEGVPVSLMPGGKLHGSPLVGVIMGSQSDLPTMNAAVDMLKKFDVPYEVDIVSAHRTPDKLMDYSRSAAGRGIRVIIAGAGGAAHLPGMVAAMTPLPVIGVPVKTSTLSGVDSLYSIVQMPRGVPVATVAIGNATNAGLLAVRILSTSRPTLRQQMMEYQREMKEMVNDMSTKLTDLGSDEFLQQMDNKNKAVNV
ncbi:Phosphoribosylaminoimidazole carboxylase, chloroplastic (Fragment) [Seminavis robusta]|uniref:phosphoribosylaminoimidazole carboxylase n=1 Tax=Seminavis robusta TaxID=568900 RepID=A0A9N8E0T3_9STRA